METIQDPHDSIVLREREVVVIMGFGRRQQGEVVPTVRHCSCEQSYGVPDPNSERMRPTDYQT